MLDCGTTIELFTILWVYCACCIVQLWCTCNGLSSWSCLKTNKGIYISYGWCWPIQLDILTCYAVGAQEQGSWAFVHCVGALLSLISFAACANVVALPAVIRGPCLVSRDYAYMGTCHKYHVMDASLSLLCWCWNHHLVTNSILLNLKFFIWPQIYLYNAMFVLFFIQMSV